MRTTLGKCGAALLGFQCIMPSTGQAAELLCPSSETAPPQIYEFDGKRWGYKISGALRKVIVVRDLKDGKVVSSGITCIYVIGETYTKAGACHVIQGSGNLKTLSARSGNEDSIVCEIPLDVKDATNRRACMISCE